ncbi:MAG: enoyl-CoA hydratase/isomerase family protein, partial [Acidobacteria bacterium]|nr:enoyl-CoA hydratase/isomerase family protein [Candidatus Sulfomarinibacter sp. MAG AM2]
MNYENLLVENRDGTLWVIVNRPDKLNALNKMTISELDNVFTEADRDEAVLAVVVSGAGEKAFVA